MAGQMQLSGEERKGIDVEAGIAKLTMRYSKTDPDTSSSTLSSPGSVDRENTANEGTMDRVDDSVVAELHGLLRDTDVRIVFAESCTAGLIAATLGRVPGISNWLAGSAVVYQLDTKSEWLDVGRDVLQDPGPVSQVVSEQMAMGVLQKTPQAGMAASVTGHLGPGAPPEQDGVAWSTVAFRENDGITMTSRCLQLADEGSSESDSGTDLRHQRQIQAAEDVMRFCVDRLRGRSGS